MTEVGGEACVQLVEQRLVEAVTAPVGSATYQLGSVTLELRLELVYDPAEC